MAKDKCVMCGKDTPYDFETHIDLRYGYIEGGGQGCYQPQVCNKLVEPINPPNDHLEHFLVSFYTVKSTPNDAELGAKVRQMYWEIYGENAGSIKDLETYRRERSKY